MPKPETLTSKTGRPHLHNRDGHIPECWCVQDSIVCPRCDSSKAYSQGAKTFCVRCGSLIENCCGD